MDIYVGTRNLQMSVFDCSMMAYKLVISSGYLSILTHWYGGWNRHHVMVHWARPPTVDLASH